MAGCQMRYTGKIIDCHVHCLNPKRVQEVVDMEKNFGYDHFCLLSAECMLDGQNDMAFDLMRRMDCTVFAGLNHGSKNYAEQAKAALAKGAKGFKMVEGKPVLYNRLNISLNEKPLMDFYAELERQNVPLLLHAGDPPGSWEGTPTPEQIRHEVEDIAKTFPRMKCILAHFYFTADNIKEAARMLDTYPAVVFDLTPGLEMYINFTQDIGMWRDFFIQFQDRILFGTDNWEVDTQKDRHDKNELNRMIHAFLQGGERFKVWNHVEIQGIDLPLDVLGKIYHQNFERIVLNQ